MAEWRTIENAPKDGTFILVHRRLKQGWTAETGRLPQTITMARWRKHAYGESWVLAHTGGSYARDRDLTHWMPLPSPPDSEES